MDFSLIELFFTDKKVDKQKIIYEAAVKELDSAIALKQKKQEDELKIVEKSIQELQSRRKELQETLQKNWWFFYSYAEINKLAI